MKIHVRRTALAPIVAALVATFGASAPALAQTGWRSPAGRYGPGTIVYRESAGPLGPRGEVVVTPDLIARYESSRHGAFAGRLSRADYDALIGMVAAARLLDLPDRLPAGPTAIADAMTAQVSYTWAGRTKTVVSEPGSHEPDGFFALREDLRALAARLRARGTRRAPPPTATLGAPPPRAPTASPPAATTIQMEYARRGGLHVADERLVIDPSGLATLTARHPTLGTFANARALDPAEHRDLLGALARSGIARLPAALPVPAGLALPDPTEVTITASTPRVRIAVASQTGAVEPAGYRALRLALERIAAGLRQPYGKAPITFAARGGFPEANDVVEIDAAGIARLVSADSRPAIQLAPDEHDALIAALADARFLDLPDRIERTGLPTSLENLAGPDRAIAYEPGGLRKTVAIENGASPPAATAALLARLEAIRRRLREQTPFGIPGLPREAIGLERLLRGVIGGR